MAGRDALVGALAALGWRPLPAGDRLAMVSIAGRAGVLTAGFRARRHGAGRTGRRDRGKVACPATRANSVDTTAVVDVDTVDRCVAAVLVDPAWTR